MPNAELAKLVGTKWTGTGELWLDPLGNEAEKSECTLAVDPEVIRYTWSYQGKPQEGRIALRAGGATWSDSWQQAKPVECADVPGAWGLLATHYAYAAGDGPDWGWRTILALRPTGELVLQMTNICPWGEEARAVRMIFTRA
jgi:hypothetical protein